MGSFTTAHLSKIQAMNDQVAPGLPYLAVSLAAMATEAKEFSELVAVAAKAQPEAMEECCKRAAENPLVTGIIATTSKPRDPLTVKYTYEGTVVYDVMESFQKIDRALSGSLYDGIMYKLSTEEKAAYFEKNIKAPQQKLHDGFLGFWADKGWDKSIGKLATFDELLDEKTLAETSSAMSAGAKAEASKLIDMHKNPSSVVADEMPLKDLIAIERSTGTGLPGVNALCVSLLFM